MWRCDGISEAHLFRAALPKQPINIPKQPINKAHLFALPVDECGRVGDQARIELPPRLVRRKMLVEEALRPIRVGSKAQAV